MKRLSKSGTTCFTHWSRKGYSAFASLGKVVKIGVLSTTMVMVTFTPNGASAQADSDRVAREVTIEELTVTGERFNPTRGLVAPVEVYGRDTVGTPSLQTVESVLRLNPTVDLRERGPRGSQADISLRGGTSDQTMVLLNGIDFTDARTGHQSHCLPVDLEIVSSIDIIGGLSGIGAYTGAVNVVTAPLRPNYLRAQLSGGQFGYLYSNISGAVSRGGLSAMAAGSVRSSDGYTENTDLRNVNLFTRINYLSSSLGLFDFQAGYQDHGFGANSFYSLAYPNQYERSHTGLGSLRWSRSFGVLSVEGSASYRRSDDKYELYRDGVGAPEGWVPNFHVTDNVGAALSGRGVWLGGETALGVDYTLNHIYSNVLGEPISVPIEVPGEQARYTRAKGRDVVGAWLSHDMRLGKTRLAGSANLSLSPYGTFPSWSVVATRQLHPCWSADVSLTRSMRLPTFTDLYYTTPTHEGNPHLAPEKALTLQAGGKYSSGRFRGGATIYYRAGVDVIDWVQSEGDPVWRSTQMTRLGTLGTELTASYRGDGLLRHATVNFGYITADKSETGGLVSKYALDYMRTKFSALCGVRLWHGATGEVAVSRYDRNGSYIDASGATVPYTPYLIVDARVNWTRGVLTLYVDATNLTGTRYFDFGGLVQAPRWVSAGVVVTI